MVVAQSLSGVCSTSELVRVPTWPGVVAWVVVVVVAATAAADVGLRIHGRAFVRSRTQFEHGCGQMCREEYTQTRGPKKKRSNNGPKRREIHTEPKSTEIIVHAAMAQCSMSTYAMRLLALDTPPREFQQAPSPSSSWP